MSDIYRINKAGLYAIGHFNALKLCLMVGRPDTCRCIEITQEKLKELLKCLRIDWEDGDFVNDLLEGQLVSIATDDQDYIVCIGDPYGNKSVMLP